MRTLAVAFILAIITACGQNPAAPTAAASVKPATAEAKTGSPFTDPGVIQNPSFVTVSSQKTGTAVTVTVEPGEPQLPTCAGRNLVVQKYVGTGVFAGKPINDILTLSNGHKVFLQDGSYPGGYRVEDNPTPWCTGPVPMKTQWPWCYGWDPVFNEPICDEVDN